MMNNITPVVKNLLILNIIVYAGTFFLPADIQYWFKLYFPASENFLPVQLVTHFFMHGNLQHLIFNMLSLFFLGPMVENYLGAKKFLILYFVSALGAMLAHMGVGYFEYSNVASIIGPEAVEQFRSTGSAMINPKFQPEINKLGEILNVPVVGASGAIYGVIIAFATLFPDRKLMLIFPPIPIKARYLAIIIIAFDLYSGISGQRTGIAHFAHLGGALFGFLTVYGWKKNWF